MADASSSSSQLELFDRSPAPSAQTAIEQFSKSEERGAIYTRPEVVEFILDLVEYTPDKPLYRFRLLEPAFGDGNFLFAAVDRLLTAYRKDEGRGGNAVEDLRNAIRAVELHKKTFHSMRSRLLTFRHCAIICVHLLNEDARRILAFSGSVPAPYLLATDVQAKVKASLIRAAESDDQSAGNSAVAEMYALSEAERLAIGVNNM